MTANNDSKFEVNFIMMKILFINVDSRIRRYGLMALSAYIKANSSHSVFLEEFSDIESAKRRVLEISPDFIAYSCMSGEYPKAKEINSHLKSLEHKFISLWGGPHPTYSQEIINDSYRLQIREVLSGIEDLDFAEAVSRLNLEMTGLEASQKAFTRVQDISLFNFL